VLYEVHVRGFSKLHPEVPEAQRGTFAGLASDAAIAHLRRLGITAVSLLPVQQWLDEERLVAPGPAQLLGLQHAGLLLPRAALRHRRQ
jgi:pullulanase/glycogen debranching enzyme